MAPLKKGRLPKRRFGLWLLVLALAVFLGWRFYFKPGEKPGGPMQAGAAPVRVAEAICQNVPWFLNGLGTVAPSGDVLVQSRVAGQLIKLHFREGQRVAKGDLLAEIDPRPFQAELEKAKGVLRKDEAQLLTARQDLERYAKLAKGDFIAEQQYENQKSLVRQWEGSVETDKAAVAAAALQLEYSRITAPIGGRLGLRNVDEGNQITANEPGGLARITETEPCDVIFTLPETQVGIVAKAMRQREKDKKLPPLQAQAWDREDQKLLGEGWLLSLDNQIDSATGTVRLKARFPNKDHALYPNQFVNVRLLVETLENAVTIPVAAVQLGAKGSYCYVVEDRDLDGKKNAVAIYTPVETGIADSGAQVIDKGVKAGDRVVVDGLDRLRDGIPVNVAATMQTPLLTAKTP